MSPSAFIRIGGRVFTSSSAWRRVPFQPVLYLLLWAGSVRIILGDAPPVPFDNVGPWVDVGWNVLSVASPPLALWSWWLILHSRLPRAALVGLWMRLSADVGQFIALLVFHLATALKDGWPGESHAYMRYAYAAVMAFVWMLILRDSWAISVTNRLAGTLR